MELRDSYCSMSLNIGADAVIRCATYTDGVHPILTIDVPHNYLSLSPAGHNAPITEDHVAKARDLAAAVATYLAEVERLHAAALAEATPNPPDSTSKPGASAAAA